MKFVSLIPARGGSKGLPRKNIRSLCDKPLIAWSIEASLQSRLVEKTFVSTDDEEIADIAREYGAEVIMRPAELALDSTPTEPVILDALAQIPNSKEYDFLVLLQPTSPLRDAKDIDASIGYLYKHEGTGLISVTKIDNKILKALKKNEKGFLEGIVNNDYPFMRRQDLPSVYMPNGAIYIVKIADFLKTHRLLTDKTVAFEMDAEKSFDIDTLEDLQECQKIIQKR